MPGTRTEKTVGGPVSRRLDSRGKGWSQGPGRCWLNSRASLLRPVCCDVASSQLQFTVRSSVSPLVRLFYNRLLFWSLAGTCPWPLQPKQTTPETADNCPTKSLSEFNVSPSHAITEKFPLFLLSRWLMLRLFPLRVSPLLAQCLKPKSGPSLSSRGLRSKSEAKLSSVIRISPRLCRGPCRIACNAPNTVSHLLITINRMQSSRIMIALDDNPTTQTSFSVS